MLKIEKIAFQKLLRTIGSGAEGMVFLGCGAPTTDWLEGIPQQLLDDDAAEEGATPEEMFRAVYEFNTVDQGKGSRTDLFFVFHNKESLPDRLERDKLNHEKLPIWRIQFGDCSWWSDYLTNYTEHHNLEPDQVSALQSGKQVEESPEPNRPPCKLVGMDGNVFSVIGLVSKTLKKDGQRDRAKEFETTAFASSSYSKVLQLAMEYVSIG